MPRRNTEYCEVSGQYLTQTNRAVLMHDGEANHWVPKSIMENVSYEQLEEGKIYTFYITEWFAKQEGMI